MDLRAHPRVKTSLKATIQLLDSNSKPVEDSLKVSLYDISAGGLSYVIRLNRKEQAALLLGHRLIMQIDYPILKGKQMLQQTRKIVAVHLQPFGEASVHVQFEKLLDQSAVDAIAR